MGASLRGVSRDPWSPVPLAGPAVPRPDRLTPWLARRIAATRGAQRRAHMRELGFRMLRRVTPVAAVEDRGMRIHLQTADLEMSRLAYIFGLFDVEMLEAALDALGRPIGGRDLLDVGANIGTTTLAAIVVGADRVVAIEPAPANVETLRLNVAANGLESRVRVVAAAASDREATVELALSPTNSGDHRVGASAGRAVVEVPAVTIDSLVARGELDPERLGLAWMDVQGHEAHALAGATSLPVAGVPVVLEYWPSGLRAAGGLDRLHEILGEAYGRFRDLRAGTDWASTGELPALARRYDGEDAFTDLLVVP